MEITTTTSYPLDGKAGTTGPRCGALESVSKSGEAGFGVLYGTDERPEEWALRLRRWKPKPLINRSATGFETVSYGLWNLISALDALHLTVPGCPEFQKGPLKSRVRYQSACNDLRGMG